MKKILGVLIVVGIALFAYQTSASSVNPNEYVVVMKFSSGNTIALSEKYQGYDACINSDEFKVHKLAGSQSGANIQCSNSKPTY